MILVGNQRGGAKDLALHLLKEENDRVEVHEIRGFVSDNLIAALQESYAMSRGTRCKQHLFSCSLNPPSDASVSTADFEKAVAKVEDRLGLTGQPRAIVFHQKNGRRHAHAVWSRIDSEEMKAVQLSHSKTKLREVARELYIEHQWRMPDGFISSEHRNPRNYTLAEWQQAKRAEKDPAALKEMFQDCWTLSDGRAAFAQALKERGYILARGDRRGLVAVDHSGEVYSVSRWIGVKAKQVRDRLGPADDLPDVRQAHVEAAHLITTRLDELKAEQERIAAEAKAKFEADRERLRQCQTEDADRLRVAQANRERAEEAQRQARLNTGLRGFLDRLTGKRRRMLDENRQEAERAQRRDRFERDEQQRCHQSAADRHSRRVQAAQTEQKKTIAELIEDRSQIDRLARMAREAADSERSEETRRNRRRSRRARDGPSRKR